MSPDLFSPDRRLALNALRRRLAAAIEDCTLDRDLAALSSRFQSVLAEIALLDSEGKGSIIDEVADRRAARRAEAKGL